MSKKIETTKKDSVKKEKVTKSDPVVELTKEQLERLGHRATDKG